MEFRIFDYFCRSDNVRHEKKWEKENVKEKTVQHELQRRVDRSRKKHDNQDETRNSLIVVEFLRHIASPIGVTIICSRFFGRSHL